MKNSIPNYMKEISKQVKRGQLPAPRGEVLHISVFHDSWCQVHDGRPCNCEPDIINRVPNRAERRANRQK